MTYEKWRKQLADANDPAFIPIAHIDALLTAEEAQFWATTDAAMVTTLTDWPGGARAIRVVAAAGKKADLTGPLREAAEEWAQTAGCTHAYIEGRDGWRHALPGYRHYHTVLVKDLG